MVKSVLHIGYLKYTITLTNDLVLLTFHVKQFLEGLTLLILSISNIIDTKTNLSVCIVLNKFSYLSIYMYLPHKNRHLTDIRNF